MIWVNGRISWAVICVVAFTTFAIVLTDLVWRTVVVSASVIGAASFAFLAAGNMAIVMLAARSGK